MSNLHCLRLLAIGGVVLANWSCDPARAAAPAPAPSSAASPFDHSGSHTVIGKSNPLLANGAEALDAGHVEEGIRLTLEGLQVAVTKRELAVGHSNACAGYVLMKKWADALSHCNAALELDTSNWRTYNNRAAIYVEQGLYDLATRDLEAGLALAPGSATLRESMRILQLNKRIMGRQARKIVPS